MPEVLHVMGPVLIAVVMNVLFYGICILQFVTYYTSNFNDRRLIKILVLWVFLLDTVHTCASIYLLWVYVIDNFGNQSILTSAPWPFSYTPLMTSLASCPIQAFLAWRILQFARSWRVFVGLVLLALAQLATGIAASAGALELLSIVHFRRLVPIVDSWLATAVVCDVTITVLLWYYLSKSRTGFKHTDHVITRLIHSSIETAAFGAIFCVMDLVTFTAFPGTNYHAIFAFPLGRIYTNTLLLTLNSRNVLRSQLSNNVYTQSQTPFPVFERPPMALTGSEIIRSIHRNLSRVGAHQSLNQSAEDIVKSTTSTADLESGTSRSS